MRSVRSRIVQIALVIMGLAVAFFLAVPRLVDEGLNKVLKKPPYAASERAVRLHQKLTIADLHADSLLWGRDLLERVWACRYSPAVGGECHAAGVLFADQNPALTEHRE